MAQVKDDGAADAISFADELSSLAKDKFRAPEAARVEAFIASMSGAPVADFEMRPLVDGAGASNGIAFVSGTVAGEALELVLRYDPGASVVKQKDFAAEFHTLEILAGSDIPAPEALWLDADGTHLGFPGFLMRRLPGSSPSAGVLEKGLLVDCTEAERHAMMLQAAEFHGQLRAEAIPPDRAPHLAHRGSGPDPLARELAWWVKEVGLSAARDTALSDVIEAAAFLAAHEPKSYAPVLVHGDAQFANLMFEGGRLSAVIDWEFAYFGHNESDVALLAHCAVARNPNRLGGVPSEQELLLAFERVSGTQVQDWEYHKAFNMFRYAAAVAMSVDYIPNFAEVWPVQLADLSGALKAI